MNTLKLYSMLKVNQKKAKETKYNHTRIILAIFCRFYVFLCNRTIFPRKIYLPTQNLLSDAEVTICKYKWLIISTNAIVLGYLKWLRGTVGGRKIGKNLQIWLPSKKENANICKIDFPVLCTFTLFNADFCTFLQSLWSEQRMNLLCPLVMLIVISNLL